MKLSAKKRKVSFKYVEYDADKKLHMRKRPDGTERIYIISPYQMAAKEGKYYLICNYDKYDDISNYRVDRIHDIQILNDPIKPYSKLVWSNGNNLDLGKYMREHVYMYSGQNTIAKLLIPRAMISDVIDLFGKSVRFMDETEIEVKVVVNANEKSIEQFARSYAPDVLVLAPYSMVERLQESTRITMEKYKEMRK